MDPTLVDALYALPAGEFVAARNALAKELKAGGDKEAGSAVAKLRRPTSTAWALNQIAREDADLLDAALAARADLRAATEGTGELDVRAATAADRDASRALTAAARSRLGGDDPGLANRINSTLLAAVLDDAVAAVVRAGRLHAEQEASAFELAGSFDGQLADVIVLADRMPKKAPKPDAEAKASAEEERARKRARLERERTVERLGSKVARLRGKVDEAAAELAAAQAELDQANADLAAAQAELDADT